MTLAWRTVLAVCAVTACAALPAAAAAAGRKNPEAMGTPCHSVFGDKSVAAPTHSFAWKAGIETGTRVFTRLPGEDPHQTAWVAPRDAPWLLVLDNPRNSDGKCWVRVRLPWRPNFSAGWINANDVVVERTQWRIVVSTEHRTLTLFKAGKPVRTISIVDGKPTTPTPTGDFAVAWAVKWHPNYFLGSWVLELTAHSDILKHFDGGNGNVGIHGRGGASLLDPLGSALSHGCVRLANGSIDWLVGTVSKNWLPGTPVDIH